MVSVDYDMNPPPVFNGHVHFWGEVSKCGPSKLKTCNAQGKGALIWQMRTTHNNTRKMQFFSILVQHRVPQDRKRRPDCFQILVDSMKKKVKARNVVEYSPY